jgi:hypothetical protein
MSALVTVTYGGGSIMFDVMDQDAEKVIAKIERLMSGYIVERSEV